MTTAIPDRRPPLLPAVSAYLERLASDLDAGAIPHPEAAEAFAAWVAASLRAGRPAPAIVVCTGNSRRSILGATMGNVVAAASGMAAVRFFSGGTEPTALNPRTIAALRAVGVEVEATGDQAPPGPSGEPNPVYRVRWGAGAGDSGAGAVEFSKRYDDASNPRSGFAALMVCDEADGACPVVPGAALRLAIPMADPKEADGTAGESARYAERRDDLARWMLVALGRARALLDAPPGP